MWYDAGGGNTFSPLDLVNRYTVMLLGGCSIISIGDDTRNGGPGTVYVDLAYKGKDLDGLLGIPEGGS